MNLDGINRWLAVATNVGVILGLGVVVYEVRQNTQALYNDADVAVLSIAAERTSAILESADVAKLVAKSRTARWTDFTPGEQFRLEILWGGMVDQLQLQFRLWNRRGDRLDAENIVFPSQLLGHGLFREWWGRNERDYQPDFVVFFETLIAESGTR